MHSLDTLVAHIIQKISCSVYFEGICTSECITKLGVSCSRISGKLIASLMLFTTLSALFFNVRAVPNVPA